MNDNLFQLGVAIKSKELYVILMKDDAGRLTLLADPGENKPWYSKNKKLADYHAKECDGEARTWQEAFDLLRKAHPEFEKELCRRVQNVHDGIITDTAKPKPSTDNGNN